MNFDIDSRWVLSFYISHLNNRVTETCCLLQTVPVIYIIHRKFANVFLNPVFFSPYSKHITAMPMEAFKRRKK